MHKRKYIIRSGSETILDIAFMFWMMTEFTITHSFIAILALVAFCGLTMLCMISKWKLRLKRTSVLYIYCFFILCVFLGTITGHTLKYRTSMKMVFVLIRNLIFFLCLYKYIDLFGMPHFRTTFLNSAVATSIMVILVALLQTGSLDLRNKSLATNANGIAVCNSLIICWLLCDRQHREKFWKSKIALLLILCILAGTRKAIMALILGVFLYICMNSPKKIVKNILIGVFALLAAYICLLKIPALYRTIGYRIESLFQLLTGRGEGGASEQSRVDFMLLGWSKFLQSPIWGHGANCFQYFEGSYGTYSHNNFIELLSGTGLLGTISFYSMYFYTIAVGIKNRKKGSNDVLIGIVLTIVNVILGIALVTYYERSSVIFIPICDILTKSCAATNQEVNKNTAICL